MAQENEKKTRKISLVADIPFADRVQKLADSERRSLSAQILMLAEEALEARQKRAVAALRMPNDL